MVSRTGTEGGTGLAPGTAKQTAPEPIRVLIVDDDTGDIARIRRCLGGMSSYAADVQQASSLDEVRAAIDGEGFDVGLVKFDPDEDHSIRIMEELGGRSGDIALILLTGQENGGTKRRALEAGALHLLSMDGLSPDGLENAICSSVHARNIENQLNDALVELERATRAKSDFFAKIGHDLKTPLNSVIGYSDALASEAFGPLGDPKYREYARAVREAGAHLLELIENLIHFSIGDSRDVAFAQCDLNELTASAIRMTELARQKRGHKLVKHFAAEPVLLKCQPSAITQAIINLLTNAIKYTSDNGRIEVTVRRTSRHAEVAIKDNGIGMSQTDISIALQPFGRVQLPPESAQEGTGLGLHIVREIMARHRGQLDVSSAPGQGTTTILRLPAPRPEKAKG
jgi:signal transduction histidine kinase